MKSKHRTRTVEQRIIQRANNLVEGTLVAKSYDPYVKLHATTRKLRWTDGDRRSERRTKRGMDRWTDGQKDEKRDGQKDGKRDGRTDRRTDRSTDRRTKVQTGKQKDDQDRRSEGLTDGRTDEVEPSQSIINRMTDALCMV